MQQKKSEGKTPLQTPKHRRDDNIKLILKIGCDGMGRIHPAQDRDWYRVLVKMVINFRIPKNAGQPTVFVEIK